jgi:peptidyl-prolyl cis-trans isomerase SurA
VASVYTDDPGSKDRGGMYEINRNQKDLDPIWLSKHLL